VHELIEILQNMNPDIERHTTVPQRNR